ncbi:MAG: SGNH/GDSL hydrolase family protein [Dehalococcoidia bacterium]|nr:SGNH/GDSL hydrolase family protein [Dehalococcoidia bacterium]
MAGPEDCEIMGDGGAGGAVLLIGDSLTAGRPGVGYSSVLKKRLKGHAIASCGRGGDTIRGMVSRAGGLVHGYRPPVLVIQAGTNDLLLPLLASRGAKWARLVRYIERKVAPAAADVREFGLLYTDLIDIAGRQGVERIIMTTITCIGEDLSTPVNTRRQEYNEAIRDLAAGRGAIVADTGKAFDLYLARVKKPGSYLLPHFSGLHPDRFLTAVVSPDILSALHGLALTLDGVHLNSRGANLFAESVAHALERYMTPGPGRRLGKYLLGLLR